MGKMIAINVIRIFLVITIVVYLIGLFAPIIVLKRKGISGHGTHEGASISTRLSSISILTWAMYILAFIIFGESVLNFLLIPFLQNDALSIAGIILVICSLIMEGVGMINLGENFRIELPKEETNLVKTGIYKMLRNPIVLGVFLMVIGSLLLVPTVISMILVIFNLITFDSKVKDEEKFLSIRFGTEYEQYKRDVGRFLPKIKKRNRLE